VKIVILIRNKNLKYDWRKDNQTGSNRFYKFLCHGIIEGSGTTGWNHNLDREANPGSRAEREFVGK
jgi:hypothetical protein